VPQSDQLAAPHSTGVAYRRRSWTFRISSKLGGSDERRQLADGCPAPTTLDRRPYSRALTSLLRPVVEDG